MGAQSANHMQYDVIINFQKEGRFVRQKFFRIEIRSLGPRLVRKHDVAKEGDLNQTLKFSKNVVNCGGA